jgi:hypothetical protein
MKKGRNNDSKGYIGLAPVLGFQYSFTDTFALDVNAKYNAIFSEGNSTRTLGLNVGVVLSFGKGKVKEKDDE